MRTEPTYAIPTYSLTADTLADMRHRCTTIDQLLLIDMIVVALAEQYTESNQRFNEELFIKQCKYRHDVHIGMEQEHERQHNDSGWEPDEGSGAEVHPIGARRLQRSGGVELPLPAEQRVG